mmetsp:Transcript_152091/g.291207  ORF Transcript_152091/g.291207 Transcript_152091/m.291207 type:complete len:263 (-) Transcript_152091:1404-2192(-)
MSVHHFLQQLRWKCLWRHPRRKSRHRKRRSRAGASRPPWLQRRHLLRCQVLLLQRLPRPRLLPPPLPPLLQARRRQSPLRELPPAQLRASARATWSGYKACRMLRISTVRGPGLCSLITTLGGGRSDCSKTWSRRPSSLRTLSRRIRTTRRKCSRPRLLRQLRIAGYRHAAPPQSALPLCLLPARWKSRRWPHHRRLNRRRRQSTAQADPPVELPACRAAPSRAARVLRSALQRFLSLRSRGGLHARWALSAGTMEEGSSEL